MKISLPDDSRRRLLQLLPTLALAGTAIAARAAERGVSAGEILVGQSISLQGDKNAYGSDALAGIRAWVDSANRAGGVYGRRVVLRTLDDEGSSTQAEAHARALVKEGVFVLFGALEGGPSTAVAKVAAELGVPFIGPMAGPPGLRQPHQPMVFPVRAEHRDEFHALITQGKRIGLQKVALFHADTPVGLQHLANVEKLAAEAGMAFGGGLPFKPDVGDAQLAAAAAALKAQGVDLVINHGSAALYARLIRAARAAGLRTTFWGVNSGSTILAAELGPLAQGMVFSQIVPNPNSGKTALTREYQERMKQAFPERGLSYGSLEGYMTAKALYAALRAAGATPTRASLLTALERFETDLGGVMLRWRKGQHMGSSFVDLAMVGRDGRFVQ